MRALLPVYCRPLGYFIIALALFLPFIFLLWGKVTDANLLFYKECSKLLMMMGALMIIFALTKNEIILNVLCLEFGIKKATVDRLFKRNSR